MAEKYIISGSTLDAIGEAIRSKTGRTEKISPMNMPAAISGITGGGDAADVRYVTFMSQDGTVEYGKKAVAVGDDCADPIARGIFATPTKESTLEIVYTFTGWSTVANGGLDNDALKSVNENRVVYANFIEGVRAYAITFYDGENVLTTQHLAYGATPSYAPTKKGYTFAGWTPEITEVTEDTSYYANWIAKLDLATLTWAEIANYAAQDNVADLFDLGATKPFTYNGKTCTARIIGFKHDDLADGSGKAGITLMLEGFKDEPSHWSSTGTADRLAKMWDASNVRDSLHTCLTYAAYSFPADLYNVMKTVAKKYYDYNASVVKTSDDKVFLPAKREVDGSGNEEGDQYEYFETQGNRIVTFDGSARQYWTRTKTNNTSNYVWAVNTDGSTTKADQGLVSYTYAFGCVCI